MKILNKKIQTETAVKGSRFLAEAIPCKSQEDARRILKEQKEKYADATHVVHAFVTGLKAEVMGMSDDGEPGGTAGRPVLDVLKGSGVTDIILTVTRWFGGTLLGTGGLVKAYGGAAKELLEKCSQEGALEEYVPKKSFSFECDYALYKKIKKALEDYALFDLSENYSDCVAVSAKIRADQADSLAARLKDLSRGLLVLKTGS